MAKGLNFRNFEQPSFPLYMNDAEETLFTVTSPTVALVERIEANQDEIVDTLRKGDRESLDEMWQLAADLISCNREHRPVTVAELKGRYGMTYPMFVAFWLYYMEFLNEIKQEKN